MSCSSIVEDMSSASSIQLLKPKANTNKTSSDKIKTTPSKNPYKPTNPTKPSHGSNPTTAQFTKTHKKNNKNKERQI